MRLLVMFFDEAREEFVLLGLEGEYLGVDIVGDWNNQKAFFVHATASGVKRTEWPDGAGCWEGVWRSMQRQTGG